MLQIIFDIIKYPTLVFASALIASFAIHFIMKIGIRGMIIRQSKIKLISKLFECDFCLSFWTNAGICICMAIAAMDLSLMLLPFFATTITLKLIQ